MDAWATGRVQTSSRCKAVVFGLLLSACASAAADRNEPSPSSSPAATSPGESKDASLPTPAPEVGQAPPAPDASIAPPPAFVEITNDWDTFLHLEKPYGKIDEPSLGGFEYVISSRTGFDGNDQYINIGDESLPSTALAAELGPAADISGTPFQFSIKHVANQNMSFRMTNTVSSVLCWGTNCPAGSTASATLDGKPPLKGFNGLQIQVRAQDVKSSSTTVTNLSLVGVTPSSGSDPLFGGKVTPSSQPTLPLDPPGRVGQWILGESLAVVDWELTGTVTASRPDGATSETSKVRFVVDFVIDKRLPVAAAP